MSCAGENLPFYYETEHSEAMSEIAIFKTDFSKKLKCSRCEEENNNL
jgi:hypothetical protein